MANLDPQNKAIIDAIAAALGMRSSLTTTNQLTFAGAINEINAKVDLLGTVEHEAADITARDALSDLVIGDRVFVADASADGTVTAGWAIYRVQSTGPNVFLKMAEQESLDVAIAANLAFSRTATTLEITIDTGTDIILPAATAILAGLHSAVDKARHDDIEAQIAVVEGEDYTVYVNSVL